ncbi:MAG TPA: hypothetical protein DCM71_12030 [Runella sp.]|nr:hypothetical protein [Runella sp.]
MKRIPSIDTVRGIVMVIMALDHIRDLIHIPSQALDPTNLTTTTASIFMTRWVTHFCAPIFVFLAGTSAYLSSQKEGNHLFLIKRGLWLVLLEFTVITFGIWWDIRFSVFLFQVIAAIGLSFVVLGLLYRVSASTLGVVGVAIMVLHGAFALLPLPEGSALRTILTPLFSVTALPLPASKTLIMGYPLIPWLGIMLAGYGAGSYFKKPAQERKLIFLKLGGAALVAFVVLRFTNILLDPQPWSVQKDSLFTFLSFINVTKYPPSLLYDLMTLGTMFLLLYCFESAENTFSRFFTTYGKVPMFYYLLHWYIVHLTMFAILFAQGFGVKDFEFGFSFGRPKAANGLPLWGVYLVWIGIVGVLYPLCRWFGKYKKANTQKTWLRYI